MWAYYVPAGAHQDLYLSSAPSPSSTAPLESSAQSRAHLETESSFHRGWLSERSIFTFRKSRLKENKITASRKLFGRESRFILLCSPERSGACIKGPPAQGGGFGLPTKEGRKPKALCTHAEQSLPVSTVVLSHAILMSCNH